MEIIHQGQSYEDAICDITDSERRGVGFAEAEQKVEALFQEIGAIVSYGLSYAGEQPKVNLCIANEQSDAAKAFSNRPA